SPANYCDSRYSRRVRSNGCTDDPLLANLQSIRSSHKDEKQFRDTEIARLRKARHRGAALQFPEYTSTTASRVEFTLCTCTNSTAELMRHSLTARRQSGGGERRWSSSRFAPQPQRSQTTSHEGGH